MWKRLAGPTQVMDHYNEDNLAALNNQRSVSRFELNGYVV